MDKEGERNEREREREREKEKKQKLYLMYWMYPCLASSRRNPGFRISTLSNTIESTHATIVKPLCTSRERLDHSTNLYTALRFTPWLAASSFASDASSRSILHHRRKSRALRARELFTKNPLFRVHRSVRKRDTETVGNSEERASQATEIFRIFETRERDKMRGNNVLERPRRNPVE